MYRVQTDGRAPHYLTTLTVPDGVTTQMTTHEMHFSLLGKTLATTG